MALLEAHLLDDPYASGWIAISIGVLTIGLSAIREALVLYNPSRLRELFNGQKQDTKDRISTWVDEHDLLEFTVTSIQSVANACFALAVVRWVYFQSSDAAVAADVPQVLLVSLLIVLPSFFLTNHFLSGPIVRWNAESAVYHGLRVLGPLRYVFYPLHRVQVALSRFAARLRGHDPEKMEEQEFVNEIESVTQEGEREGAIEEEGARMIKGILRLQADAADEAMVPRIDIKSVSIDLSIDEAATFALEEGHSRIPVYEDNMDKIVGLLYVKDLLKYWRGDDNGKSLTIREIMRKPTFVPETMRLLDLLRDFRKNKNHMAIVLDEYGGTSGLITIEDILEEIVGEIEDEYDLPVEESFRLLEDGSADVDAKLHIDEINDAMHLSLDDHADYDTIGGFVFSTLGKIPDPGESFVHGNVRFTVTDAGERRINRVMLTVLEEPE